MTNDKRCGQPDPAPETVMAEGKTAARFLEGSVLAITNCTRCKAYLLAAVMEGVRQVADNLSAEDRAFLTQLDAQAIAKRLERTALAKAMADSLVRPA